MPVSEGIDSSLSHTTIEKLPDHLREGALQDTLAGPRASYGRRLFFLSPQKRAVESDESARARLEQPRVLSSGFHTDMVI